MKRKTVNPSLRKYEIIHLNHDFNLTSIEIVVKRKQHINGKV